MGKIPESAQELFNERLPAALAANADKASKIGAVYLFRITGEGGGDWTVDLRSSPPTCTSGDGGAAMCTIEVAHADFKQMLTNPALGMQLYFQDKLRVTGDPMLATKLQQLFALG